MTEVSRVSEIRNVLTGFWNHTDFSVQRLAGDASTRCYYRSLCGNSSVIVMDREAGYDGKSDPFINLTYYLQGHGLPVPAIRHDRSDVGILILQDLGDVTLQAEYASDPATALDLLYRQVFEILVTMHRQCKKSVSDPHLDAFNLRFDYRKLIWELNFFLEHFVVGSRLLTLSQVENNVLHRCFDYLCRTLEQEPLVFTHRDFHARNLMVSRKTVYMIDYQDARLGPPEYDLASVLRDAYVRLPESFIESFLKAYYRETGDNRDESRRRFVFSLMCVQRNLKALGTFGYQHSKMNKNAYLVYVPVLKDHLMHELTYLGTTPVDRETRSVDFEAFQNVLHDVLP